MACSFESFARAAALGFPAVGMAVALLPAAQAGPRGAVRVRATEATAPCVQSAARAYGANGGSAVAVETGALEATADVLVGSGVEMTRALESGAGRDDSDIAVAELPWVLVLSERAPSVKSFDEAVAAAVEIEVLRGPAAHDAQRWLADKAKVRLREADAAALKKAEAALVPASLAGPGRRVAVDVPALSAQAAVGSRSAAEAAGRAFVAFLGSEPGRRAFAACLEPSR